jgi:hypothetical protein
LHIGRLAIERILEGYGYELPTLDVIAVYNHFMAAAHKLEVEVGARNDVLALATKAQTRNAAFSDTIIRQCSSTAPVKHAIELTTWTRRKSTRH